MEELEEVPNNQLDERERYWIKKLDTYNNGYNLTKGGLLTNINVSHIKGVMVEENELVVSSKEELSRLLSKATSWSLKYLSNLLRIAIDEHKDFLGYHIRHVDIPSDDYLSDENEVIDWAKTLAVRYSGKHIYCPELDKHFDTISNAARYLLDNNLYTTRSKTPLQSLITSISANLRGKTDGINGVTQQLTFLYMPGTTKYESTNTPFIKSRIYCPQLDKTFESQLEAAKYMVNNNIWTGIKEKTAKLRISDIVNGNFPDYKGYTFSKL